MSYSIPSGQSGDARSCFIFSLMSRAVLNALPPGSWNTGRPTDGRLSSALDES